MKEKHLQARIKQCLALAECSPCPRHKFGCVIIDPERNVVVIDSYNGTPRKSKDKLCGGDTCLRDTMNIVSGTRPDIGCDHAEINAICNAAYEGIAIANKWLVVNGEPCIGCARAIYAAGIAKVFIINGGYTSTEGLDFLRKYDVDIESVEYKWTTALQSY